ncbi:MAG: phosphatase PAP2 family protein [Patescibacteria group bacterium]
MDLTIFQAINNFAGRWEWLDQLGIFLASGMAYVLVAVLVALWFLRKEQRRMVLVSIVSAVIARGVFVAIIRALYHRARPISVDAVHQLVTNDAWAFPSGHASFFFALATGVFLYNKKLGSVFYIFAALMGLARIFVGVHWPTDILVGAALGMLTALGVDLVLRNRFQALNGK